MAPPLVDVPVPVAVAVPPVDWVVVPAGAADVVVSGEVAVAAEVAVFSVVCVELDVELDVEELDVAAV